MGFDPGSGSTREGGHQHLVACASRLRHVLQPAPHFDRLCTGCSLQLCLGGWVGGRLGHGCLWGGGEAGPIASQKSAEQAAVRAGVRTLPPVELKMHLHTEINSHTQRTEGGCSRRNKGRGQSGANTLAGPPSLAPPSALPSFLSLSHLPLRISPTPQFLSSVPMSWISLFFRFHTELILCNICLL